MAPDVWPQAVLDLLAAAGRRTVFEHAGAAVTGAEMLGMVRRIATGLRAEGVGPGDDVVLRLGVDPPAFAAILAAFTTGVRVAGARPDQLVAGLVVDDDRVRELLRHPADPVAATGGDVARIVWTSGSTGEPKGCCHSYAAMTAAWAPHPDRWPPAVRDLAGRLGRFLVFGSLTSQVMLEYSVLCLAAGGTLVTGGGHTARVSTVGRLRQIVRDRAGLRAVLVSGSPLPPVRLREALAALGPVVFNGYGQTETGMIAMLTPDEMLASDAVLDSVGRPPGPVQIRGGELYARTAAQATAYLDDPAETAAVFTGGWVRTRDLATLGADGYLRLTGRARDVIIVHAELVHAGAVERVLAAAPQVAEAYVVGRPDPDTGEAVHAYVVPAAGRTPDPDALRTLVAARLGPKAVPATVTTIGAVPLGPSGKPDKSALG